MITPVEVAREILTGLYSQLYEGELKYFCSTYDSESQHPTWFWVDSDLERTEDGNKYGGLLWDPEIGVCLYLLPYSSERGVRADLSHALRIRSKLLPERNPGKYASDPDGAWRVLIHWMVEPNDFRLWVEEVSKLRGETAHFEEIPVDAIVNRSSDWGKTCTEFRFPRLLLKTRYVLGKKHQNEVESWSSVDALVARTISDFPGQFRDSHVNKYAKEVVEYFNNLTEPGGDKTKASHEDEANTLNSLRIQDIRKIEDLSFTFDSSGGSKVGAWIIHGPNGTGKSSIYEALSFALAGTSYRYEQYLADKNDRSRDKRGNYIRQYLAPLGKLVAEPSVTVNDKEVFSAKFADKIDSVESPTKLVGTLLSQEQSADMVGKEGTALGAEIVGESSFIANEIRNYVGRRYDTARSRQQEFLDRWELNTGIKNKETARARISEKFINERLPLPESLLAWLKETVILKVNGLAEANSIVEAWEQWQEKRKGFIKSLSKGDEEALIDLVSSAAKARNHAARETVVFIKKIQDALQQMDYQMEEHIQSWGEWLEARKKMEGTSTEETAALLAKQKELQNKQKMIVSKGTQLRARMEHLESAQSFLQDSRWGVEHNDECPTCATDLRNRNGIASVINEVQIDTNKNVIEFRKNYQAIIDDLKKVDKRLLELGAASSPISEERQAELIQLVQWLLPSEGADFREIIASSEARTRFIELTKHLRQVSSEVVMYSDEELNERTENMANILKEAFIEVEVASLEENSWREIQGTLNKEFSSLLQKHFRHFGKRLL